MEVLTKSEEQTQEAYEEDIKQQLSAIPLYAKTISTAVVMLGEAVTIALNLRDRRVIEEMRTVCTDIFTQAQAALDNDVHNLQ